MPFDIHAHLMPDEYFDLLDAHGHTTPWRDLERSLEAGATDEQLDTRIAEMDAAGIDCQVLSTFPDIPDLSSATDAAAAAMLLNDLFADIVRRRPGRFSAFAALPLPHVDAALEEARRALALGLAGVAVPTALGQMSLAHPDLEPFWADMSQWQTTIFLHPVGACPQVLHDLGMTWSVGATVEDTIAAAALIAAGVPRRHPGMRIINSHAGGAISLLLQRLDSLAVFFGNVAEELPSATARRMWWDTVVHRSAPALRCVVDAFGSDRLVYGSDFPVVRGGAYVDDIAFLRDALGEHAASVLDVNVLAAIPPLAAPR